MADVDDAAIKKKMETAIKKKLEQLTLPEPEYKIEINYSKKQVSYIRSDVHNGKQDEPYVVGSAPLDYIENKLMEFLKSFLPRTTVPILLPQGVRYYESDENHQAFLIEVPPAVYTLHYDTIIDYVLDGSYHRGDGDRPVAKEYKTVDICIPWQYFWIEFKSVPANDYDVTHSMKDAYLFWAPERITSLNSYVYPARLPNINPKNGKICLGDVFPSSQIPPLNRAEEIVNLFYESKFNDDIPIQIPYPSFDDWVKATKINPYAWIDWQRIARGNPLSAFIAFTNPKPLNYDTLGHLFDLYRRLIDNYREDAYLSSKTLTYSSIPINTTLNGLTISSNVIMSPAIIMETPLNEVFEEGEEEDNYDDEPFVVDPDAEDNNRIEEQA